MDAVWFLLALWIGFVAGFFVSALMAMARDKAPLEPVRYVPLHPRRAHY